MQIATATGPFSGDHDRARHNLPLSVTSFVGRAQELEEVRMRLEDERLLT
jgi:hypothetical protein